MPIRPRIYCAGNTCAHLLLRTPDNICSTVRNNHGLPVCVCSVSELCHTVDIFLFYHICSLEWNFYAHRTLGRPNFALRSLLSCKHSFLSLWHKYFNDIGSKWSFPTKKCCCLHREVCLSVLYRLYMQMCAKPTAIACERQLAFWPSISTMLLFLCAEDDPTNSHRPALLARLCSPTVIVRSLLPITMSWCEDLAYFVYYYSPIQLIVILEWYNNSIQLTVFNKDFPLIKGFP